MKAGIFFIVCFSLLSVSSGYGQSFDYKENSAYIYNFIRYIDWSSKKTNITVGIVGKSPVEAELKNLIGKKKKNSGLTLSIRNINIAESKDVDVVIVAAGSSASVREISQLTIGLPVLIISEKENEARAGACISFFLNEENNFKTQYQLSMRNCRSRGLQVSDQILNNAILTR